MRVASAAVRFSASLLVLAGGGGRRHAVEPAEVTIESASSAWVRQVEWAIARFDAAGLELPAVVVTVHADDSGCNGNAGLFRHGDPVEVELCSTADVGSRAARLITLHELAHAWAETQLTAQERHSFVALRGLDVWSDDRSVPRHEWAAEHAAEAVSWGLMDELVPIVRIHDTEPAALAVAFEHLTGERPAVCAAGSFCVSPDGVRSDQG
jgi:hypothetical protein